MPKYCSIIGLHCTVQQICSSPDLPIFAVVGVAHKTMPVQTLEVTMFARQHERILFRTRNWSVPSSPSCHCCPVTLTTTICKVIQIRRWRSLLVKWHLFFSRWNYVHFTGKNHVLILLKVSTVTPSCCTFLLDPWRHTCTVRVFVHSLIPKMWSCEH